jgi:hypothetical protein
MRLLLIGACKLQCFGRLKIVSRGPSTIDGMEIIRFCAFAPPGSPLNRCTVVHFYCEPGFSVAS